MNFVGQLGVRTREKWGASLYILSVAWTVLRMAVVPRYWPQPTRNVLARQILFTGIDAVRFISFIAVLVGLAVILQTQFLLKKLGMTQNLGPILVAVIFREIGPLLTNFAVIGRSGNAMATELANMKINGEVHLLDSQGIDPFLYLVLPRAIGAAIATFCLSHIFVAVSFLSGYLGGMLLGVNTGDPEFFFKSVFSAIGKADVFNLMLKSFVPGLLMGCICCIEGLSVQSSFTEVPQATSRAVVRSTLALFISAAVISVMTYA